MTQPSFAPVPAEGRVRPTVPTTPSVRGQRPKPGLRRTPEAPTGVGLGTQAPGEGFALTLAEREIHELGCESEHDAHDVATAVGLLAAKRASLAGRGPTRLDVQAVLAVLGLGAGPLSKSACAKFRGLSHDYFAQRRFVDSVADASLLPTF